MAILLKKSHLKHSVLRNTAGRPNEIEIRNLRYDVVYRTLCGLSLIGPNRYNEKKRIPDFMKKWHCKRCQKKEAQMKK